MNQLISKLMFTVCFVFSNVSLSQIDSVGYLEKAGEAEQKNGDFSAAARLCAVGYNVERSLAHSFCAAYFYFSAEPAVTGPAKMTYLMLAYKYYLEHALQLQRMFDSGNLIHWNSFISISLVERWLRQDTALSFTPSAGNNDKGIESYIKCIRERLKRLREKANSARSYDTENTFYARLIRTNPLGADLSIKSEPNKQSVICDSALDTCPSPQIVIMEVDSSAVTAKLSGYNTQEASVDAKNVSSIENAPLQLNKSAALINFYGELDVRNAPSDSMLILSQTIDGTPRPKLEHLVTNAHSDETAPSTLISMPAGEVNITIKKNKYIDKRVRAIIDGDNITTLPLIQMEKDPQKWATLIVDGTPKDVTVYLGREKQRGDTAPFQLTGIEPGKRRLTIQSKSLSWSSRGDIVFEPGKTKTVIYALYPEPSYTLSWIGTTLTGSVAIAGFSVSLAAYSRRKDFYSSDNPTRENFDQVDRLNRAADVLWGVAAVLGVVTLVFHIVKVLKTDKSYGEIQ